MPVLLVAAVASNVVALLALWVVGDLAAPGPSGRERADRRPVTSGSTGR